MTKKTFTIDDFSISEHIPNKEFGYNFIMGKTLQSSYGIREFEIPYSTKDHITTPGNVSHIMDLTCFKQYYETTGSDLYRILLYGDDNKLYTHQMFGSTYVFYYLYSLTFESAPIILPFRYDDVDAIIMADTEKVMVWKPNVTPYTLSDAPVISSMCINDEVLFCTVAFPSYKIWYNKSLNLENLGEESSDSGYISLDDDLGRAVKVVTYNEYVYVFRDYGITKISVYKDEMSMNEVYRTSTMIYGDSVSSCGNLIVFATADGIYYFNGSSVYKCDIDIDKLISSLDNCSATSLGENYYIALKMDFGDDNAVLYEQNDYTNNAILIVNMNDFSYQIIRGIDVLKLKPLITKTLEAVLVTFNQGEILKIGEMFEESSYFDTPMPKHWEKKDIFENSTNKLITKLSVIASANTTFCLTLDDKEFSFTTLKDGLNEFCLKQQCRIANLTIDSEQTECNVKRVEIEYYDCWYPIFKTNKFILQVFNFQFYRLAN